jgi:PIN domain nuclease of toxin-antitoxin system
VRLLLDTHAFLWFLLDDPQLSPTAQAAIEDIPLISADPVLDAYGTTRIW